MQMLKVKFVQLIEARLSPPGGESASSVIERKALVGC